MLKMGILEPAAEIGPQLLNEVIDNLISGDARDTDIRREMKSVPR
jgi:hypothetical protein